MDNEYKIRANRIWRLVKRFWGGVWCVLSPILKLVLIIAGIALASLILQGLKMLYSTISVLEHGKLIFWGLVLLSIILLCCIYIFVPPLLSKLFHRIFRKRDKKQKKVQEDVLSKNERKFINFFNKHIEFYDVVVKEKVAIRELAMLMDSTKQEFEQLDSATKAGTIDFVLLNSKNELICGIEITDPDNRTVNEEQFNKFMDKVFRTFHKELYRLVDMSQLKEGAKLIFENLESRNLISKKVQYEQNDRRCVDNYEERSLLTHTEKQFYLALQRELVGYDVVINTKTRLEDLVSVKADSFKEIQKARGYVKSRHIDFVLCDSEMNVICGIEVDDQSHEKDKAKEIDEFKNDVFRKLGKELYRIVDMNQLEKGAKYIVENLVNRNLIKKK